MSEPFAAALTQGREPDNTGRLCWVVRSAHFAASVESTALTDALADWTIRLVQREDGRELGWSATFFDLPDELDEVIAVLTTMRDCAAQEET